MQIPGKPDTLAEAAPRTVAVLAYQGCGVLDITAPIEVFNMANRVLTELGAREPIYRIALLAQSEGVLTTSSGVRMVADSWHDCPADIDTLIVVGSPNSNLKVALANRELVEWIREMGGRVRRIASVCTGAFLLAEAGLLDGRRATTHWMSTERLATNYPFVSVEPDAIYVRDCSVATSAGVSAGLDLSLSFVEEDFGRKPALTVARRLVLYLKRPGGQTQFSTQLRAQMAANGQLAPLLSWLEENPGGKITVEEMAERAAMSPRNFVRVFLRETGVTPAKYMELVRLERAIRLLEETRHSIEVVAGESGFASAEQMRRTFSRHLGINPAAYRARF